MQLSVIILQKNDSKTPVELAKTRHLPALAARTSFGIRL